MEMRKSFVFRKRTTGIKQAVPVFEEWEVAGRVDRVSEKGAGPSSTQRPRPRGALKLIYETSGIEHSAGDFNLRDSNSEASLIEIRTGEEILKILNAYIAVIRHGGADNRKTFLILSTSLWKGYANYCGPKWSSWIVGHKLSRRHQE